MKQVHSSNQVVRQSVVVLASLSFLLGTVPDGYSQVAPSLARLPNFDGRTNTQPQKAALSATQQQGAAQLKSRNAAVAVDVDPITGSPAWIHAQSGFLTRSTAQEIARQGKLGLADDDPHRAVKAFLIENSSLFGHGAEVLTNANITRDSVTGHNGMRNVVWQQELDGIPVFEALLVGNITKNGELVSLSSRFVPDTTAASKLSQAQRKSLAAALPISAKQATMNAATNLGDLLPAADLHAEAASPAGSEREERFTGAGLRGQATARLVWLPMDRSSMRLCWSVFLSPPSRGESFQTLIDAQTGDALVRHCLTDYISPATYRVFTSDSPSPFSPGSASPTSYQPPLLGSAPNYGRQLVTISALSVTASPNGWINDGDNETAGNNVDAHLDYYLPDNEPDLPRPNGGTNPDGSPKRLFDFPLDLGQDPLFPEANRAPAIVNLFYWCNWMHDKLYDMGFTEAAGNFQNNNFGRGGVGNDAIQADAMDGSGLNNANFTTPPDGTPGRMQMYLWSGPSPRRDGDLDAEIILHEYTHGLSNRRVGGGMHLGSQQSAGLGEGWSDFYSLAMLSEAGDDLGGNYAQGGYTEYLAGGTMTANYYYGHRAYPYSTNMATDPQTLSDIDATGDPHPGIPRNPLWANVANWEVHAIGEVWCTMLWEARAEMIVKHGFAGNQLMLQLVTDAMPLTPGYPNFTQARDAILLADAVNNHGENLYELWRAFAKRGLGYEAIAPNGMNAYLGYYESYEVPAVSISVVDGSLDETGANDGVVRLGRGYRSREDTVVSLQFSGTATFGSDYLVDYFNIIDGNWVSVNAIQPTAVIPSYRDYGASSLDLYIRPIPDTRDEGTGETVIVKVLPSSTDGTYGAAPGADTVTVTITDDDNLNLPPNGWKLTDLGATNGLGINNLGQAVGSTTYYSPAIAGFYWDNGYSTYLPPWYYMYPEDNYSFVRAINNGGLVVGYWAGGTPDSPSSKTPVFYYPEYFDGYSVYLTSLPYLPGGQATLNDGAEDISNAGIIVGQSGTSGGKVHAVAWRPASYGYYPSSLLINLGDVGGGSKNSFAAAVNELGEVVGRSEHANGTSFHAFRATAISGVPQVLTTAGDMGTITGNDSHNSEARDLNDLGELVGNSWTTNNQYHAMYKVRQSGKNKGWLDLGVLAQGTADTGNWSRANGINSQGIIVGQSTVQVWIAPWAHVMVQRGFVASNAGNAGSQPLVNLTDQSYIFSGGTWYTAASQGYAVVNAERINDSNWIVGTATQNGTFRAVVLSPR